MKNLFAVATLLVLNYTFAQEPTPPITTTTTTTVVSTTTGNAGKPKYIGKKNELKLDAFYLIFGSALNLTYERVLNEESGIGATLILSSGTDIKTTFSLTPYYRFYFGKKPAAGFFFEGFASVNSWEYQTYSNIYYDGYYYNSQIQKKTATDLALGLGLGGKFITNNGILFELSVGVGRNLLNDYNNSQYNNGMRVYRSEDRIFGRGGLSIGYRF